MKPPTPQTHPGISTSLIGYGAGFYRVALGAGLLPLPAHEFRAKRTLGFVLIVGATSQAHAVDGGFASARYRVDVVVLQVLA
jgi:hypothetical protein